jgi:hypothetical protein
MTKCQLRFSALFTALALAGCIETSERVTDFEAPAEARITPLRAATDLARGVRWELGWGRVAAYDVASGRLIRTIPLPGATLSGAAGSCLPDMVLDRAGALIVSSNITTRMWRIGPARFEVEVFDIEPDRDANKDFGFTSLAWSANDRELYAASAIGGALWRIDLNAGKAVHLAVSEIARGECGPLMGRGDTPAARTSRVARR